MGTIGYISFASDTINSGLSMTLQTLYKNKFWLYGDCWLYIGLFLKGGSSFCCSNWAIAWCKELHTQVQLSYLWIYIYWWKQGVTTNTLSLCVSTHGILSGSGQKQLISPTRKHFFNNFILTHRNKYFKGFQYWPN